VVDSLTYNYYLNGNWNELITLGKQATNDSIDFKYLQQRMGYAYFVKGNYFAAISIIKMHFILMPTIPFRILICIIRQ